MLGAGSDFSWKELWNEMQLGMLMGWMLGAVISTLVVFAPIYAIVGGILIAFETLMVVVAGIGVVISLKEGKIAQALFRALLLFFAYKGLKRSIDKYGAKAWESLKSLGKKLGDHIIELHNDNRGMVDLDALSGKKGGKKTVDVNGKTVTMDNSTFDPNFVDKQGRTNIQRMEQGLAPIGTDGKSVNIHHIDQTNDGPVMEITATEHQQNYSILHINIGQSPSQINRSAFNNWRRGYWEWRSNNLDLD